MGGKFTIAGTVIGVLTIQTLEATILFLGVPSAQSPVFFALVIIVVVLVQSPRLHSWGRTAMKAARTRGASDTGPRAKVAS
jgi:simple sugar transport system permease protein